MSQHPSPVDLTYTPVSRATMLNGAGEALAEIRKQAQRNLSRGRVLAALRLHLLHGRIVDTVVELVTHKSDPGTDAIRLQLASLDAQRVAHAQLAANRLDATARWVAAT